MRGRSDLVCPQCACRLRSKCASIANELPTAVRFICSLVEDNIGRDRVSVCGLTYDAVKLLCHSPEVLTEFNVKFEYKRHNNSRVFSERYSNPSRVPLPETRPMQDGSEMNGKPLNRRASRQLIHLILRDLSGSWSCTTENYIRKPTWRGLAR